MCERRQENEHLHKNTNLLVMYRVANIGLACGCQTPAIHHGFPSMSRNKLVVTEYRCNNGFV
jgi:hypothetical protein